MFRAIFTALLLLWLSNSLWAIDSEKRRSGSSDSATTQYLLGVIDYNKGDVASAKVWFQRAWESLKAEEGAEGGRTKKDEFTPSATPAKVQFPEGYKVNVYYRDGWYIQPKNPSVLSAATAAQAGGKKQVYSFLPGSTYKIRVKPENEQPGHKRINMGMKVMAALVMISWLISR